jgi:cysteinyl-tRNA synthetase
LHRFLKQNGYRVRYVMNITDVDDKIIRNSARDGVDVRQYTAKYEKAFMEDAATLGIQQPLLVRATEHIPPMADFIAKLEQKGLAYRTEDGSYYFRIAQVLRLRQALEKRFRGHGGWRAFDVDEYEKDNAREVRPLMRESGASQHAVQRFLAGDPVPPRYPREVGTGG